MPLRNRSLPHCHGTVGPRRRVDTVWSGLRVVAVKSNPVVAMPNAFRTVLIASSLLGAGAALCTAQSATRSDRPPNARTLDPKLAHVVALAEPTGRPDPRRLATYLAVFQAKLANDPRLFLCDITAHALPGGGVRLEGFVEFSQTRHGVVEFFRAIGFQPVEDRIVELPDPQLGDARFGVIRSPHALSYDRPAGKRSVVTDCLFGEPLLLLRKTKKEGQWLCHSEEGYLGYVSEAAVRVLSGNEFAAYLRRARFRVVRPVQVSHDKERPGGEVFRVPIGGRVIVAEEPGGSATSGEVELLLAGRRLTVPRDAVVRVDAGVGETSREIVETARRFLEVPYRWGGKTSAGIDCSGLAQVSFASAGIDLPRDSNQQVFAGRVSGVRWFREALAPGDTLYFLGPFGRIRHTAIYVGDDRFIEATQPVVRIASFNPTHADFDRRRVESFAFAKRVIGAR